VLWEKITQHAFRGVLCSIKSCIIHRYLTAKMIRELVWMPHEGRWRKLDLFGLRGGSQEGPLTAVFRYLKEGWRVHRASLQTGEQ